MADLILNDYGNSPEEKEGDLRNIQNASSVLYMRKNTSVMYRKDCPLKGVDEKYINYKNLKLINKFISERGKIMPNRVTGMSKKKQRLLRKAIIRARMLALVPFSTRY